MNSFLRWTICSALVSSAVLIAQPRRIDTRQSTLIVRVYKTGLFSAFAHDHEISAPISSGSVDSADHRVTLRLDAKALRVRDPGTAEKERNEIQSTMLGPNVLDTGRYPEIAFDSYTADSTGASGWTVRGTLTLHGASQPVTVEVSEKAGHYIGYASVKQTAFGIKPISIAGGAVKVKDEVRVEFDIQLK